MNKYDMKGAWLISTQPDNVMTSGLEPVLSGVIYAIVGAIASQNGGKVASRIVRERILKKLR